MISSGADEVKIRKLKAEHAYEERQLEIREQEHRLHVNEQFKEEQGRAMMKYGIFTTLDEMDATVALQPV